MRHNNLRFFICVQNILLHNVLNIDTVTRSRNDLDLFGPKMFPVAPNPSRYFIIDILCRTQFGIYKALIKT